MTVMFKSCRAPTRPVVEKPLINWRKITFKRWPMNRERTMTRESQTAQAEANREHVAACNRMHIPMDGAKDLWSIRMVQYVLNRVDGDCPHSGTLRFGQQVQGMADPSKALNRAQELAKLAKEAA
jgi:hypothetical protein